VKCLAAYEGVTPPKKRLKIRSFRPNQEQKKISGRVQDKTPYSIDGGEPSGGGESDGKDGTTKGAWGGRGERDGGINNSLELKGRRGGWKKKIQALEKLAYWGEGKKTPGKTRHVWACGTDAAKTREGERGGKDFIEFLHRRVCQPGPWNPGANEGRKPGSLGEIAIKKNSRGKR